MPQSIHTKIALVQMLVTALQGEVADCFPQNSQRHIYTLVCVYIFIIFHKAET